MINYACSERRSRGLKFNYVYLQKAYVYYARTDMYDEEKQTF